MGAMKLLSKLSIRPCLSYSLKELAGEIAEEQVKRTKVRKIAQQKRGMKKGAKKQ